MQNVTHMMIYLKYLKHFFSKILTLVSFIFPFEIFVRLSSRPLCLSRSSSEWQCDKTVHTFIGFGRLIPLLSPLSQENNDGRWSRSNGGYLHLLDLTVLVMFPCCKYCRHRIPTIGPKPWNTKTTCSHAIEIPTGYV